ncbi:MAG: radical SAM protein [Candidatus Eisenbacteria bacterium]|nr:radical SAM protein [Candidatus Eisenbacteria bacterium]
MPASLPTNIAAGKSFTIATLGCRANQEEEEAIRSHLCSLGYEEVLFPGPASIALVHTCAVTSTALAQSRQAIRRCARRGGEQAWVVALGCGAQFDAQALAAIPGVALVVGNRFKARLPAFFAALGKGRFPPDAVRLRNAAMEAGLPVRSVRESASSAGTPEDRTPRGVEGGIACAARSARREDIGKEKAGGREQTGGLIAWDADATAERFLERAPCVPPARTRGLVKIQDGCDRACAYCIVPALRGRPRSRDAREALRAVERLCDAGCKEIVVTGVHLGLYACDLGNDGPDPAFARPIERRGARGDDGEGLAELLEAMGKVRGLGRVRLSSIEPDALGPRLLDLIADAPWICPHLHLPLQSGDDRILARMGRRYGAADIRAIGARLARASRPVAIGLDILAGFPGEDGQAFDATLSLIDALPGAYLHAFPYSERPGTAAASFPERVVHPLRAERVRRLREIDRRLRLAFQERLRGRTVRVLVEKRAAGAFEGLAGEYVRMRGEARACDGPRAECPRAEGDPQPTRTGSRDFARVGELVEVTAGESIDAHVQACKWEPRTR